MKKRIRQRDRQRSQHNHCHADRFCRQGRSDVVRYHLAAVLYDEVHIVLNPDQKCLQRNQIGIINIKKRIEPVIPEAKCTEKTDSRNTRQRDWQHNPCVNAKFACSVDLGRFDDGIRYSRRKEGAHHDNIEGVQNRRKYKRPNGIP
ncbi:hypothetical protein D3C75_804270 [compost metagenome]